MLKHQLLNAIQALTDELVKTGKIKTAAFFDGIRASIETECNGDRKELSTVIERLCRSGAIVQYANLSAKEERLFASVHDLAAKFRSL
jgi:hypothetical protein